MSYTDTILNALPKFRVWAIKSDIQSDAEAWEKLQRADWMLWFVGKRGIKLDESKLRHFAVDCAEDVLPIFERKHPDDKRIRKAIQAARRWAEGKVDTNFDSVWRAARAAAMESWDIAAWTVVWVFARKFAKNAAFARACVASANAAMAAAGDAAWTFGKHSAYFWDSAWNSACDAAMKTQADRLRKYFPNPFVEES
jgi:hypothetical protein